MTIDSDLYIGVPLCSRGRDFNLFVHGVEDPLRVNGISTFCSARPTQEWKKMWDIFF